MLGSTGLAGELRCRRCRFAGLAPNDGACNEHRLTKGGVPTAAQTEAESPAKRLPEQNMAAMHRLMVLIDAHMCHQLSCAIAELVFDIG